MSFVIMYRHTYHDTVPRALADTHSPNALEMNRVECTLVSVLGFLSFSIYIYISFPYHHRCCQTSSNSSAAAIRHVQPNTDEISPYLNLQNEFLLHFLSAAAPAATASTIENMHQMQLAWHLCLYVSVCRDILSVICNNILISTNRFETIDA